MSLFKKTKCTYTAKQQEEIYGLTVETRKEAAREVITAFAEGRMNIAGKTVEQVMQELEKRGVFTLSPI